MILKEIMRALYRASQLEERRFARFAKNVLDLLQSQSVIMSAVAR